MTKRDNVPQVAISDISQQETCPPERNRANVAFTRYCSYACA